ncbi:hypothetical protein NMG60_11014987 [Bertholletia excelsa]
MEKKQLDLDAPLMSVRRVPSKLASSNKQIKKKAEKPLPHRQHSLPISKSDWDSAKPAAVPFLWEQIPGRAKGKREADDSRRIRPQGGVVDVPQPLLEELFREHNVLTPLNESNNGGDCNSEREDGEYSDALDTLSAAETLSMNCSMSGLSGSDMKHSKTFSADVQARDFMMNRFLPAAQAMVLETPEYAQKKQPTTPEHPIPIRKVVSGELKSVLEQQHLAVVPYYSQQVEEVESEDEDDKQSDYVKKPVKFRGLFSRFCLRNSLCLLNPVPGIKARRQIPVSPAKDVNRMARTAYSGPLTQITDKNSWGFVDKQKMDSRSRSQELHKVKNKPTPETKRLSYSGDLRMMRSSSPFRSLSRPVSPFRNEPHLSHDPHKVKNKPASESSRLNYSGDLRMMRSSSPFRSLSRPISPYRNEPPQSQQPHKVKNIPASESSRLNYSGDLRMMRSLSPYRSSSRGGLSPYQNESPQPLDLHEVKDKLISESNLSYSGDLSRKGAISPYRNPSVSPFREGVGFLGVNNDVEKVKDVSCPRRYKMVPGIKTPPAVEKTVYIDSVNTVKFPLSETNPSGAESFQKSASKDVDNSVDNRRMDGTTTAEAFVQERTRIKGTEGSKLKTNWNTENSDGRIRGDQGDASVDSTISPRPPPLPKSPSESWLWRTLPSISLSHSKKRNMKSSNTGTKWETIVKTSNVHHDHVRYSEELVARVSQHSRT